MAKNRRRTRKTQTKPNRRQVIQIDVLHDDVLLEVFDFYVKTKTETCIWISLVHVCRRWRNLVFRSPRRLDLQLFCRPETPAKDRLDIWPAFPLIIRGSIAFSGTENVIAALRQSNRVREVILTTLADTSRQLELLAAMQVPFPELTKLRLQTRIETPPVIPESFLGGSAPRLRYFELDGTPFPGLPNLLLSSDRLVSLILTHIPHSGYISPEAMVALISELSSLRTLSLKFRSRQSRPDLESRGLPPQKRSILPSLVEFHFQGATEYLEALVTRINTPRLKTMDIDFLDQIDFEIPRLAQFISVTPTLRAFDRAQVEFGYDGTVSVELGYRAYKFWNHRLQISTLSREQDWQLLSIEQICNSSLLPLSTVEDLYINPRYFGLFWEDDTLENLLWLPLFSPFTAVKNLYLSKEFESGIAAALQELVGSRITEVFPSLQNIYLRDLKPSGPLQDIRQFVAARRLSSHPIAISLWE